MSLSVGMHEKCFAVLLLSCIVSSVRVPLMPVEVDLSDTSKGLLDTPDGQPLSHVNLGKLCAKKTPFMLIGKNEMDIASLPCDGVLGLAHQTASDFLLMPVVDKLATEDKTIEHSFTIWTKNFIKAGQTAGFLTIGEADTEHCDKDHLTLRVQRAKYWEFRVQQIIVKKSAIHGNHGRPLRAVMNSRQNFFAARPDIIDKLVTHFKAKETKEGFRIDCGKIPALPVMKFDVTLENAPVQFLVLRPDDYTFKIGDNCFLAFSKSRKILEADLEFGTLINRNFCQTYNYGKGTDEQQFASIVLAHKKTD
ncbi:Eukaryotic aspartyl protease superfamily [Trichuris trichiura]|uniref:Eukaryotic aspartyl protease superfamily n=1 Tax=Trichuris trichiura TaxID=36087 RepID=A0A077Z4E5_TRITR|nr:Eukaryotic aspartyl protease superfamily [Trichuris trichiura]